MQIVKLALLITLIGGVSSDVYQDDGDSKESRSGGGSMNDPTDYEPDAFQLIQDDPRDKTSSTAYARTPNQKKRKANRPEQVKTRRRDMSHLLLGEFLDCALIIIRPLIYSTHTFPIVFCRFVPVGDPGTGASYLCFEYSQLHTL